MEGGRGRDFEGGGLRGADDGDGECDEALAMRDFTLGEAGSTPMFCGLGGRLGAEFI